MALADGFPANIPLVDGTVVASTVGAGTTFTATIKVANLAAQDAALAKLEQAGFVRTASYEQEGLRSYSYFSPAGGAVTVIFKSVDGARLVAYTVSGGT
jgi:hypothetical protein